MGCWSAGVGQEREPFKGVQCTFSEPSGTPFGTSAPRPRSSRADAGAAERPGRPLDRQGKDRSGGPQSGAALRLPGRLGFDTLDLSVAVPPTGMDDALMVAAERYAFCPADIDQGSGSVAAYAQYLLGEGAWDLPVGLRFGVAPIVLGSVRHGARPTPRCTPVAAPAPGGPHLQDRAGPSNSRAVRQCGRRRPRTRRATAGMGVSGLTAGPECRRCRNPGCGCRRPGRQCTPAPDRPAGAASDRGKRYCARIEP
ncbi:DUF4253 domain-containing protein [Streptomyces sp. AC495_CC817]|uniref:DUF4253 domain-containing protein n=1 Tax=Streptomyces sp. AC495_CC817 TaxID=2823900 RepID=UPI0035A98309